MISEQTFEHIPLISQPKELKTILYQHQRASIYEMEEREEKQRVVQNDTIIDTNISVNADSTGYGKCHGRDTPIIMYNGEIKMVQDIKVGDLIMGDDSTPRKILSLARGKERMYKIIQNIGDDYIVNESHILSLDMSCPTKISKYKNRVNASYFDPDKIMFQSKTFNYENYGYDKEKTLLEAKKYIDCLPNIDTRVDICIKDYMKLSKTNQRNLKGYKSRVDCWEDQLNKDDLDPYFIGLWLGDGATNSPEITTDSHIINALRKYNMLNNKHIPSKYKVNTRENRLKLLAGLIDSDGYYHRGVYEILQKNTLLSKNIKFLCGSLGFRCVIKNVTKSCMYKNEKNPVIYRITISGINIHEIPVLLDRKKALVTTQNKNRLFTGIKIQKLDIDDYYGFSIDGNHRYLLEDFTVTHNTLAMVTLVYRDKMKWDMEKMFEQSVVTTYTEGQIKKTTTKYYEKLDVTLVLVSQSIIHQWYDECHKTPLSVKMITTNKLVDTVLIKNYDIILVTPTMYNKLVSKYSGIAWKRFIFDEPGHLKVTSMNRIVAGFIWLVTATPDSIIAKHRNCTKSFIHDIVGGGFASFSIMFSYMIIKNNDEFIKHSFEMPLTNHIHYKCYNPIYKAVSGLVTENITLMISAGNIQGAIKALGGGETKNIAELIRQQKIFERDELTSRLVVYKLKNKNKHIDIATRKIKRIDAQLEELSTRYDEILTGNCSICFSQISDPVMEPNCQNVFCGKCLLKWMENKNSCPLCRDSIVSKELIYINMNESKTNYKCVKEPQLKTKIDTTISLIKNKPDGRFIIFSAWDQTFSIIRECLNVYNISFIEVKGGVKERKRNIKSFKDGNIQVIFLNSRFNGAGINLQESSDIIVYHQMDDSTLDQIIGRANRIGRIESLNVHHLQI
jgi:hypothetical protein